MMKLHRKHLLTTIVATVGAVAAIGRRAEADCGTDGMTTFTSGLCTDVNYNSSAVWSSWDLGGGAVSASISIRYYDAYGNVSYNDSATLVDLGGGFDISFNAPPSGVDWSGGFDMVGSEYGGGGSSAGDGTGYTTPCF